jgi:hypothetical protein
VKPTELLTQFRALGGIADNVCVRQCQHGHGLFAVRPGHAVRVFTPAPLLISPRELELTPDNQVRVRSETAISPAVVAFHESYQRSIAWGAGGLETIRQHHQKLCALPDTLKNFLQIFGFSDDLQHVPTPLEAFKTYCISRQILVNGESRLMPVLELINHAQEGAPYQVTREGVSLSGSFEGEVLARYRHHMDAFHFFFNYHFATPGRSALSCEVRVELPGFRSLRVSRWDGLCEVRSGVRMPQVCIRKDEIQLSFVELVNLDAPALPRQVFLELLLDQGLPASSVHALFNGLLGHNRQVLQDFLTACDSAEGPVVEELKAVAACQLENLPPI